MNKHPVPILLLAVFLGGGASVLAIGEGSAGDYQYQSGLLATVRVSALFFLVAFTAGPLLRLTKAPWLRPVVANRRYIGLGFALTHSFHLAFIVLWVNEFPELLDTTVLVGGGIAYVLMYLQALTSNDYSLRKLGRYWRWLHTFSMYYLWFIMTVTFVGHDYVIARIYTAVLVIAMIVRLVALWTNRRRKSAAQVS